MPSSALGGIGRHWSNVLPRCCPDTGRLSMSRIRLTQSIVKGAKPSTKDRVIWDTVVQGFGLRIRLSGKRSYIFGYRTPGGRKGQVRRVTIQAGNVEQARIKAKALAALYHGGRDPAADKAAARSAPTVGALLDRFLADHV